MAYKLCGVRSFYKRMTGSRQWRVQSPYVPFYFLGHLWTEALPFGKALASVSGSIPVESSKKGAICRLKKN